MTGNSREASVMFRMVLMMAVVVLGLVVACGPPARPTPAAPKKEAPAAVKGNPDSGKQLFISQGCGACHIIRGLEGASGTVGPDQTDLASRAGQRVAGLSAEQYIRQSIQEPDAYTVDGFQKGVMPKLPLSEAQVNDLVAFLLTQQ